MPCHFLSSTSHVDLPQVNHNSTKGSSLRAGSKLSPNSTSEPAHRLQKCKGCSPSKRQIRETSNELICMYMGWLVGQLFLTISRGFFRDGIPFHSKNWLGSFEGQPRNRWESFRGQSRFGVGIISGALQYQPSVSTLKEVLMKKWNLIQNQPLLCQIFKEPPIISYKKGKSLKDMLVRAKIQKVNTRFYASMDVQPVTPCILSQIHTYVLTGSLLVKSLNYSWLVLTLRVKMAVWMASSSSKFSLYLER